VFSAAGSDAGLESEETSPADGFSLVEEAVASVATPSASDGCDACAVQSSSGVFSGPEEPGRFLREWSAVFAAESTSRLSGDDGPAVSFRARALSKAVSKEAVSPLSAL
jgi:hypothetical protein